MMIHVMVTKHNVHGQNTYCVQCGQCTYMMTMCVDDAINRVQFSVFMHFHQSSETPFKLSFAWFAGVNSFSSM